ncbi:MAG: cytochrome c biogenesis protein CcdA [Bacteroidales bacterium]
MKRKIFATVLSLFVFASFAFAQMSDPVKWTFSVKQTAGSEVAEIIINANIDAGYHLYSQKPVQDGPIPTEFTFDKSADYELVGKPSEPKGVTEFQQEFGADVTYFDGKAVFVQKIKVLSDKDFTINGTYVYMVCNDGSCVPFFDNAFSVKVKGVKVAEKAAAKVEATPVVAAPVAVAQPEAAPVASEDSAEALTATEEAATEKIAEVVPAEEVAQAPEAPAEENQSLWSFFLFAFGGGLVGLLTPCVFPMIPMTVSFFIKKGAKGKVQALIYGASIVLIYTLFGLILSVLFGENFGNLVSTHWLPNLIFAFIFLLFAISLFGYFEISAPSFLVNKSVANEDKGDFIGPVFMALTLVLVSFSCTLPVASTVAISAVGGEIIRPIVGMLGYSLAFAIPFTLFAFFPSMMNKLPKSGGWLNSVKVCLAFIELAFALKFINTADEVYGWRILDREIYLAAWIVIFTLLGFYLLGKLRFPHDSETPVIKSWFRLLLAIASFTFVVYMIPGLWGAPLKALSGWMPSMKNQDFNLERSIREISVAGPSAGTNTTAFDLCEAPKYAEKLSLPHGLKGYFDYDQALACAKKLNKPVFLDFTGKACVNCRKMEQDVFSNPGVLKSLRENFVIAALYVDERTIELPQNEWFKDRNGREAKLLSQKNADIQITKFKANAQPYYVIINPDGTVLTKENYAFDPNASKFLDFLNEGIANFAK